MQQIPDRDSDSRSAFVYNKKKKCMRTYIHQNSAIYATNPDRDSDSRSAFVYNKKYKFPDIHKRDEYIHTMYIFTKKHYT